MLDSAQLTGFVATADPVRAKRFYQVVLGLRLLREDPYALVFACGMNQLRVQVSKEFRPQSEPAAT